MKWRKEILWSNLILGTVGVIALWFRLDAVCRAPSGRTLKTAGALSCWEGIFYRYQTLVIGILSLVFAAIAARVVYGQLKAMQNQNSISQRQIELMEKDAEERRVEKKRVQAHAAEKAKALVKIMDDRIGNFIDSIDAMWEMACREKNKHLVNVFSLKQDYSIIESQVVSSGNTDNYNLVGAEVAVHEIISSLELACIDYSEANQCERDATSARSDFRRAFALADTPNCPE